MTTLSLSLSSVTVVSNKPTKTFGQQARAPLASDARILTRAAIPPEIPATATVTSATIVLTQIEAISGSFNVSATRHAAKFDSKTTWNKNPATTGSAVTVTKSSPGAGTLWSLDVTSDVQAFISGTATNYGWRLSSTAGTRRYFKGAPAASGKPKLVIVYTVPAAFPTGLSPAGGAVSVAKPVLTWNPQDGITAAQVQVDPAANGVTPAFDSGEVTTTGSLLNLAATAYAGLADATSTSWRVRVRTAAGLSAWSAWATFERRVKGSVTIVQPTATVYDGSPPVQATFSGTLTAYQFIIRDVTGKVLSFAADTVGGYVTAADPTTFEWTPPKGLTTEGQVGSVTAYAVDDKNRVATPGDPITASATLDFTLALTGSVPGVDTLHASQRGMSPTVWLTGTRSAGIPDEVVIFRNGVQIDRVPGLDVFTGTLFEYADYTAPPNMWAEYQVRPFTTGTGISSSTLSDTIRPTCTGLWLLDPEGGGEVVLWGVGGDVPEGGDIAVVHQPVTGDAPAVRRRLSRPPKSGTMSGDVVDVGDYLADDTLALLDEFAEMDQGHIFRAVIGHTNLPVIIGNVQHDPTELSSETERVATASLSWWAQ